jgi:hypothetical protein
MCALNKWDVVRVFRQDLLPPHDKFCICICPVQMLFVYINSSPPAFRKKREHAIEVSSFEILCLTKTSYIDTTSIVDDLPQEHLAAAISDPQRRHGSISPSIRQRMIAAVEAHGALPPAHAAHFI